MKNTNFIIGIFLLSICSTSHAQNINALKAAYVFYFSKFISWENTNKKHTSSVNICFDSPLPETASQFYSLTSKSVRGKPIVVFDITKNLTSNNHCHIIYTTKNASSIGKNTGQLIISEEKTDETDINFFIKNNKLRFSINKDNINGKDLHISSRLLQLAAKVNR